MTLFIAGFFKWWQVRHWKNSELQGKGERIFYVSYLEPKKCDWPEVQLKASHKLTRSCS